MNKALREARKRMRGQTGKAAVSGSFDNSPLTEGKHIVRCVKSDITEDPFTHKLYLRVEDGDDKGKWCFPYNPDLNSDNGIMQCARNITAILGDDAIEGAVLKNGQIEVDFGDFFDQLEDLAAQCIDEKIEVTVKNSKPKPDGSHLKNDGTSWQNVYINRGLGEDAEAANKMARAAGVKELSDKDNLNMTPTKKKGSKKKVVAKKKKVTKRK